MQHNGISRRGFVRTLGLCAGATAVGGTELFAQASQPSQPSKMKLGFDHFSVRGLGWKAAQLIDYAGSLKVDTLLLSEASIFESDADAYLRDLKSRADANGVALYTGMNSICPSSGSFDKKAGTAVEQIERAIRIAKELGSPVIRCYLGRGDDRLTEGGIDTHIRNTVEVCKQVRSRVKDAGLKLAVENHAGDMQAWELASLIEAAGTDYVGANVDPGNAIWTMEDPLASLETLAPYVACTSVRDSALWESPDGVTVQWTAVGDGQVDFRAYVARLAERAPGVPLHIETISGGNRTFAVSKDEFWKPWTTARAHSYSRWLALARGGKARPAFKAPEGQERRAAEQAYQKEQLERSLAYCRKTLGIGVRS